MFLRERTVYPVFYNSYSSQDMKVLFEPNEEEMCWAKVQSKKTNTQGLLLILLKTQQHLGVFS